MDPTHILTTTSNYQIIHYLWFIVTSFGTPCVICCCIHKTYTCVTDVDNIYIFRYIYILVLMRLQVVASQRCISLQWRHNGRNGISNHRRLDFLLNRLFRRRSKKTSSSASLAFTRGIRWRPVDSTPKEPVTRKMFSCDDVTCKFTIYIYLYFMWRHTGQLPTQHAFLIDTPNEIGKLCLSPWFIKQHYWWEITLIKASSKKFVAKVL